MSGHHLIFKEKKNNFKGIVTLSVTIPYFLRRTDYAENKRLAIMP